MVFSLFFFLIYCTLRICNDKNLNYPCTSTCSFSLKGQMTFPAGKGKCRRLPLRHTKKGIAKTIDQKAVTKDNDLISNLNMVEIPPRQVAYPCRSTA